MRDIRFRAWAIKQRDMIYNPNLCIVVLQQELREFDLMQYTGLKDKKGVESAHFDIANDKYLLYLDLVYGLYLIDISNGAIKRYEEGIINEITGNYFEQHEKISANCQRSIDKLISQAGGTM